MQCWELKKHGPHPFKDFQSSSLQCTGREAGERFIDRFSKSWSCLAPDIEEPCEWDKGSLFHAELHYKCGWRWRADLTKDEFQKLCKLLDMSDNDMRELL